MSFKCLWPLSVFIATKLLASPDTDSSSPFHPRNYGICQDFQLRHEAKVTQVIAAGDGLNNLYVVDAAEPYFSWPKLLLRIAKDQSPWKDLRAGDRVNLTMGHTTSDVPLMNRIIEEGYFDSVSGIETLSYLGFATSEVETVQELKIERHEGSGEAGTYIYYTILLKFKDGHQRSLYSSSAPHAEALASPGEQVLIADGISLLDHSYMPNPFGNKRVIQKHRTGPLSREPLYRREAYGLALFNLSRGSKVSIE